VSRRGRHLTSITRFSSPTIRRRGSQDGTNDSTNPLLITWFETLSGQIFPTPILHQSLKGEQSNQAYQKTKELRATGKDHSTKSLKKLHKSGKSLSTWKEAKLEVIPIQWQINMKMHNI
jgi:hypothetical protein